MPVFEIKSFPNSTMMEQIDERAMAFKGDITQLESAIGALIFGRHLGWRPLYLIHDKRTLRKYEEILGVKFQDVLPPEGVRANKSVAWKFLNDAKRGLKDFWKAVKGEISGVKSQQAT